MAAFRLTPSAEEHIGEIVGFIATDNESAAVRVRHALYSAFDLLASRPGIGHTRDDLTERALKFWSVYSYRSCTTRRANR
jgi:plasmid stabilization system protein ParE